jgi:hypothetical protein
VQNDGCEDLEIRKVYVALPDPDAEREGYRRVIDESGEAPRGTCRARGPAAGAD